MLSKRIFWTLLMTAIIAVATVAQAQSTGRQPWPSGGDVNAATPQQQAVEPVAERQAASPEASATDRCDFLCILARQKTAIVGAWLATSSDGSKALLTFNSDGTLQGSAQGAVNLASPLGAFSGGQGVWQHLGGRQFGKTLWALRYDINTGQLNGFVKVRTVLTLNETGDQMAAQDKLEVLSPDGKVIFTATDTGTFTRIKFEPFN